MPQQQGNLVAAATERLIGEGSMGMAQALPALLDMATRPERTGFQSFGSPLPATPSDISGPRPGVPQGVRRTVKSPAEKDIHTYQLLMLSSRDLPAPVFITGVPGIQKAGQPYANLAGHRAERGCRSGFRGQAPEGPDFYKFLKFI